MNERHPGTEGRPPGFGAFGIFLFFGASMAALAAMTLLNPGTVLDRAWELNPRAYAQLAPLGRPAGVMFLLLSAALCSAGIGWFLRRMWAWKLAVVILAVQALGDLINLVRGDLVKGSVGFVVACLVLLYLCRHSTRSYFRSHAG